MKLSAYLSRGMNAVSKYLIGSGIQEHVSKELACKSHRLMQRAQLITSSGTGTFNLFPLGVRSLEKLTQIIDKEMGQLGCQKVSLSCLSSATPWKTSGRWDNFGNELIKFKVSSADHCLSPTHEESITSMVASSGLVPSSALPVKIYQMTTKFRDEPRPRLGLLRCREFLMKDLYTFDDSKNSALETYDQVGEVYGNIFKRLGLECIKAVSDCGKIGGEMSHEFLVASDVGEDIIFLDEGGKAWNAESAVDVKMDEKISKISAIELGHMFYLGTHYSEIFGACCKPSDSNRIPMHMGCFGLGVTRVLASCVEVFSKEDVIRWPYEIAPFKVCILPPKAGSKEERQIGNISADIYANLETIPGLKGDIILDDRLNKTIGRRLHDAEVIGFPVVIVMGKHIVDKEPKVEVIFQNKNETMLLSAPEMFEIIAKELT